MVTLSHSWPRPRTQTFACFRCPHVEMIDGEALDIDVINKRCRKCGAWNGEDDPPPSDQLFWVTKDNEVMAVRNMKTTHLQYSINMIMNRDKWRKAFLVPMLEELKRRKEAGEA